MATIGQQLLMPEDGWRRYDFTYLEEDFITKNGAWIYYTDNPNYYGGGEWGTNTFNSSFSFYFKGESIRFYSSLSNNRDSVYSIKIDGVELNAYSQYSTEGKTQVMLAEKAGMQNEFHLVSITKTANTNNFIEFDCIDINSEGELRLPLKKTTIKNPTTNQHYSLAEKTLISLPNNSNETIAKYGIESGIEVRLDEDFDKIQSVQQVSQGLETGRIFNHRLKNDNNAIKKLRNLKHTEENLLINSVAMTSDSAPAPFKVSASGYATGREPYYVFDKVINLGARTWVQDTPSNWIQLKLEKSYNMTEYTISRRNDTSNASLISTPKNFDVLGSNNGIDWTVVDTRTNIVDWAEEVTKVFSFENTLEFQYYRWNFKQNNRDGGVILDEIEMYSKNKIQRFLVFHENKYKTHDGENWITIGDTVSNLDYIEYGIIYLDLILESDWNMLEGFVEINHYTENLSVEESFLELETEPFKVYDYISETPTAIIYTESTDDIKISTTTEKFDLYDEFGEEVELLYYTDDEAVTEADLVIDANWSPVDELEGDFEVVTWTDESQETAQRVLEMTAIPKPQFIKLVNPKNLYGYLEEVVSLDISSSYRDSIRYLIQGSNINQWYSWNDELQNFAVVDATTEANILKNGMTSNKMTELNISQWEKWTQSTINIGVFLKDNPRDTIVSVIDTLSYKDFLPRNTSVVEKASFYILNTTATINIELQGNTITGSLSDDDLTRVQYKVVLNGNDYYPLSGEFTPLAPSPQNINIAISSSDVILDDWNTVTVYFQDAFGTVDSWTTNFIGTYTGLMFKDVYGDYYSSEIGEVLKYLDFGTIIAGQTTIENEVVLKNQYGYDVNNILIYANTSEFPNALNCQFSPTLAPFVAQDQLSYGTTLANGEELSFFIRLKSELGVTPDANGIFDIIVRADKVE